MRHPKSMTIPSAALATFVAFAAQAAAAGRDQALDAATALAMQAGWSGRAMVAACVLGGAVMALSGLAGIGDAVKTGGKLVKYSDCWSRIAAGIFLMAIPAIGAVVAASVYLVDAPITASAGF
jgi:hypothetical protein